MEVDKEMLSPRPHAADEPPSAAKPEPPDEFGEFNDPDRTTRLPRFFVEEPEVKRPDQPEGEQPGDAPKRGEAE